MVFVTAELGTSWNGDGFILEKMIQQCKENKIDAVKFQCLSDKLLERHSELNYYKNASLNPKNIEFVNELCKEYKIPWYATITDFTQVEMLCGYDTPAKIRCADSNNLELVEYVIEKFDKVFISSTYPLEIKNHKIVNLYCIPKYPTDFGEINFDMIKRMDGYSNHCLNPLAILRAVRMGASYLEFHLTNSKDEFSVDNKVAFTYNEMREFMTWIKPQ